jgi:FkbM family methyltransferase
MVMLVNIYDHVLQKIGREKGSDAFLVNIGAMDGVMFDESWKWMEQHSFKALYVEPIPYQFEKLKKNLEGRNALFENCAISTYDGTIQMITIDPAPINSVELHECFYGLSAVYPPKNGLSSSENAVIVEKYGRLVVVPCMTLETLFTKHNIEHIDVLSIDAEGHDWKILKQLDLKKYRPQLIRVEYESLTEKEKEEVLQFFSNNGYMFHIVGQDVDAIPISLYEEMSGIPSTTTSITNNVSMNSNVTIVTGLWDLGRGNISNTFKRSYDHYKEKFIELLKTPSNLFIYVSKEDEALVWQHRSRHNTFVKVMEVEEFKTWFAHYDKVQEIRNKPEWSSQAGWLKESPQATLEYYNPIVMSKMFLLNNATIFNPFDSTHFYWIDGGITSTVHPGYFSHDGVFENLEKYSNEVEGFVFLSYPYEGNSEVHGFERRKLAQYCRTDFVRYVCRGGFFGGKREDVNDINGKYYAALTSTLSDGYMGTEESVFTILAHNHPELINRFVLKGDGLIWPFFEKLKDVDNLITTAAPREVTYQTAKNIIYVLSFNSPEQFESVCKSIQTSDSTMYEKSRKILINNSTNEEMFTKYDELCTKYNFEEIHRENLGVCGGRQFAAEHFAETDAHFYMFFEDDMHLVDESKVGSVCRNGFRQYVPNLYDKVVKIMLKEKFDFLKFSFSEFYGDNSIQWAWYNVPQSIRTENWPNYDKLPEYGIDPNAPKTQFNNIKFIDEIPYITGEIYYSNWPQIVSRDGNKKMFLDTKWSRPYEQTWMSHMYQLAKRNELTAGLLLASPVIHDRFDFYDGSERKES